MKISCFLDLPCKNVYRTQNLADIKEDYLKASKMGISAVDVDATIFTTDTARIVPGFLKDGVQHDAVDFLNFLNECSLGVASVYSPFMFNYTDEVSVANSVERLKQDIVNTAKVKAPFLMVVPLPDITIKDYDVKKCRQVFVDILNQVTSFASEHGVVLTIEDYSEIKYPDAMIEDILYVLENVPGLKFTFDTCNFICTNQDLMYAFDVFKDYIVHTHINDLVFSEEQYTYKIIGAGIDGEAIGNGFLPNREVIKRLKEINYDNALTIEIGTKYNAKEKLEKSVAFLRGKISA